MGEVRVRIGKMRVRVRVGKMRVGCGVLLRHPWANESRQGRCWVTTKRLCPSSLCWHCGAHPTFGSEA